MSDLRPCRIQSHDIISDYVAIFHKWVDFGKQTITEAYNKRGIVGIIEYPSGTIGYIKPENIIFLDTKKQLEKMKSECNRDCANCWKTRG